MAVGAKLRWYIKIPLKLILARIPLSHKTWYSFAIFKHGKMQDFSYARDVFIAHLARAGLLEKEKNIDKVVMELGPGESLFSALLARAYGFKRTLLIDVGAFALPGLDEYQNFSQWLANQGLPGPSISNCVSIDSMLAVLDSQYHTDGLDALRNLPDDSVDLIFSQAVLEHVRKNEFVDTVRECWRLLRPGGVCTHVVDYKDHLEESLNNLRFSDQLWEAEWIASSGFYTNRIRLVEMIRIFEEQGFVVNVLDKTEWRAIPIPKERLNSRFMAFTDAELKISGATLRLRKPA
jgi:predicted SAM-dependent methyltransferase